MTNISRGLLIMAFGIAFMSVMDGIIKHLSGTMSAPQVLFFRAMFGLIPVLAIAKAKGGFKGLRTNRPWLHVTRGCLGAISFTAFAMGIKDMSLANGLAICFAAPFFMVAFSSVLIGEHIGRHRISAMCVGFIGVLIVLQPDEGILSTGAPYMIVCAAGYALTMVLARKYSDSETPISFSVWSTVGMFLFGLACMPFFWVPVTAETLMWSVAMGLAGGVAHYFMTMAVKFAPPAVVSPMEYTALIWAAAFDWFFWQLIPEHATLAGSMVIIASGIYILWRERLHQKAQMPITGDTL